MNVIDSTNTVILTKDTLVNDLVEEGDAFGEVTESPSFDLNLKAEELDKLLTTLKIHAPDLLFSITNQLEIQFDSKDSISYPMSYSQFKLDHVSKQFNLKIADADLFDFSKLDLIAKEKLVSLEEKLADNSLVGGKNEKVRSEAIVFPILVELGKWNQTHIRCFSGESFEVDKKQGLKGVFDYLISGKGLSQRQITVPVLAMVEAKKADIEEGLGQCAAEMYAARLFNQQNKSNLSTIYGAVTSGKAWNFLKLEGDTIFIDKVDYYHSVHLQEIMTILQKIVDDYKITL